MSCAIPIRRLATAAGLALLAACGGSSDTPPDPGADGAAAAGAPDQGVRSACSLLTDEEAASFAGEPVRAEESERGVRHSKCTWFEADRPWMAFAVTVYWTGGRAEWEAQRGAIGAGAAMLRQEAPDVNVDSIVRPGPVLGVGDEAYFHDTMPSWVLAGDRLLEMYVMYLPGSEARFAPLARLLVSRL
jgi:hypothetical protein